MTDEQQDEVAPIADGQMTLSGGTVTHGGTEVIHGGQGAFFPSGTGEVRWAQADSDDAHKPTQVGDGVKCSCGWHGGAFDSWTEHYVAAQRAGGNSP